MKRMNRLAALAAGVASVFASGLAVSSASADVIFDSMSKYRSAVPGISVSSTSSSPNTYMGVPISLATGATSISGFDAFPVNLAGSSYTALRLNIFVWDTINTGTVSTTAPAFSNLLGSYSFTSTGTFNTGFFYSFESATPGVTPGLTLTTPISLTDNVIGITFNYQGSTNGTTFSTIQNLTSLIAYGATTADEPVSVGSRLGSGYYRNANSESNGNFTSTFRSLGGISNQTLGFRVYGAIPEPSALGLLAPAGLMMTRRRRA